MTDESAEQPTASEIVSEYLKRLDDGEQLTEESIILRYPQLKRELLREFEILHRIDAAREIGQKKEFGTPLQNASTRALLRCPHCQTPTEAESNESFRLVLCGSCGKSFSLVRDRDWPKHIHHFELIDRVGIGGFGSVWKARDNKLGRLIALKLPRQSFQKNSEVEQFLQEARTSSKLDHPNIVKVYEVGLFEGSTYIASALIDGKPLSHQLEKGRLSVREATDLVESIARALHHAHDHGVVHRDLKPSNVIIRKDGVPFLSDFGLARHDASDMTVTMTGDVLGTPQYMSPEQARGDSHTADRRSDVYSLGVVLYELLTGEVPFRGPQEVIYRRVQREEPVRPTRLNPRIPFDLETICLKCLEKTPDRRYQTAEEVADELARYKAHKPINARPVSLAGRSWRWAKREPAIALLSSAILLLVLTAATLGAYLVGESQVSENQRLWRNTTTVRNLRISSAPGYRTKAFRLIREIVDSSHSLEPEMGQLLREEAVLCMGDRFVDDFFQLNLEPFESVIHEAAISPDSKFLAVGFKDGKIRVGAATSNQLKQVHDVASAIVGLSFVKQATGYRLVCAAANGTVASLTLDASGAVTSEKSFPFWTEAQAMINATVSSDGAFIAAHNQTDIFVWNLTTQQRVDDGNTPKLDTDECQIRNVDFRVRDGETVVVAGYDTVSGDLGGVLRWNLQSGAYEKRVPEVGGTYDHGVAISADGTLLAFGSSGTSIYDLETFDQITRIPGDEVVAVTFSPNEDYLAIAYVMGDVELRNLTPSRPVFRHRQASAKVRRTGVKFSEDGRTFLVWNAIELGILDLASQEERVSAAGHRRETGVSSIRFVSNEVFATAGKDKTLRFWNATSGARVSNPIVGSYAMQSVSFHPSEAAAALGSWGGGLFVFNTRDRTPIVTMGDRTTVACTAFSPSGKRLAVCGGDGVKVWDWDELRGGLQVPLAEFKSGTCRYLEFKSENELYFVHDGDQIGEIDIDAGEMVPLGVFMRSEGWHGLALSPANNDLLFVDRNGALRAWDTEKDRLRKSLSDDDSFQSPHIAVSTDGLLAGLSDARTVSIWDVQLPRFLFALRPERAAVWSLAWSPDGQRLVVGLSDGAVAIWQMDKIRSELESLGLPYRDKR